MKSEDYIELLRKKRKLRKLRFLIILAIIISLIAFYIIAFKTNIFALEEIVVQNNNVLDTDFIIETAKVSNGDNVLSLSTKKVKANLSELPYIDSTEIEKKLPNSLIINVKERSKAFQIQLGDITQVVSSEGFVLENISELDQSLPQVVNLYSKAIDLNKNIYESLGEEKLEALFRSLESLSLLNKMHIIDFEDINNIVITSKEGIVIDFGDLDEGEYKVKLLNEVMTDLRDKEIGYKKIIMNKGSNPIIIRQD